MLSGPVIAPHTVASEGDISPTGPTNLTTLADVPSASPQESEDCLFLDVYVPRRIFRDRFYGEGSPVMVWIHGGGFTFGSKTAESAPTGIMAQSVLQTGKELIFVAINYRVRLFVQKSCILIDLK